MKTSVIEVRDMLSVLSVQGVEDRIGDVPGVESVTVNFSAGNATVRYDETRLDIADIKSDVRQRGYDEESAPGASGGRGHRDHAAPAASASPPGTAASKPSAAQPASTGSDASAATGANASGKAAQPATAPSAPEAAAAEQAAPGGGEKMSMPDKG